MFRDFLAFLVAAGLSHNQVNVSIILAFLEYLVENGLSPDNIANYIAAIRAMFITYSLPTRPLRHEKLQLFMKAIRLNKPFTPNIPTIITEHMLTSILIACELFQNPLVFKALYSFAFFSFLRMSNLLPHTVAAFDITRQLCRGDIFFSDTGATVLLKWSKTLQDRREVRTIVVLDLGDSPLCPCTLLKTMLKVVPGNNNAPLFSIYQKGKIVTLTDSVARKHLKALASSLKFPHLTFHMFRKGGTTWAFQHGVSLQDIMAHGTWSSQAIWKYIKTVPSATSPVANSFRTALHS